MKKRLIVVLLIFTTLITLNFAYFSAAEEKDSTKTADSQQQQTSSKSASLKIDSGKAALESEYLKLFVNTSNAEITILDKRSGQLWYSNPPELNRDTLATGYLKGKMASQITLEYLTKKGQVKEYNSFNDCVQKKQFEIKKQADSILVIYSFGSKDKGVESMPQKISKKRFEEVLLNKLTDQNDKDELNSRYNYVEDKGVYERREIPKSVLKRVLAIFDKAGYTAEDLKTDNLENGIATEGADVASFTVQLEYKLDKDSLLVSVNTKDIKEVQPFRINTIGILDYFGAAGKDDKGYMFIPDGSGALINLNNGKAASQPVALEVYGEDYSIHNDEKISTNEVDRMPVFGLMKNGAAYFGIIEEGEALAKITADTSGRLTSYNAVSSRFTLLPTDTLQLNPREFVVKTPDKMYQGDLKIRYAFLNGKDAGYSGMASYYRNYLVSKYGLKKTDSNGDQPFYLELTGLVSTQKSFFGFSYDTLLPLTDIKQTKNIIDELGKNQIEKINLKYTGCFNGGVKSTVSSHLKLEGDVGSKDEWMDLNSQLTKNGGGLYPNISLLRVYKDSFGFSKSNDTTQFLSRKMGKVYHYSRAMYIKWLGYFSHYILSPNKLGEVADKFVKSYKDYDTGALSLDDIDNDLSSDFNKKHTLYRQESEKIIDSNMKNISKAVPNTMLNGGNIYLLPYAKHMLNVPEQSNEYQLEDETVPFYQMVLHGYVEYAGTPFNSTENQDLRMNILKSIETGSNVYYSWFGSSPYYLKFTENDSIYSNYYKDWINEAVLAYKEVNSVLKQVKGQVIVSHDKLAEGVYKTTYENGKAIIVNYTNQEVTVDGQKIEAEQYKIMG